MFYSVVANRRQPNLYNIGQGEGGGDKGSGRSSAQGGVGDTTVRCSWYRTTKTFWPGAACLLALCMLEALLVEG